MPFRRALLVASRTGWLDSASLVALTTPEDGTYTEIRRRGRRRDARNDKLRRKNLSRLARARNLELRHSSYGYSLIDAARNRIDDRSDMSLNDVESYLDGGG